MPELTQFLPLIGGVMKVIFFIVALPVGMYKFFAYVSENRQKKELHQIAKVKFAIESFLTLPINKNVKDYVEEEMILKSFDIIFGIKLASLDLLNYFIASTVKGGGFSDSIYKKQVFRYLTIKHERLELVKNTQIVLVSLLLFTLLMVLLLGFSAGTILLNTPQDGGAEAYLMGLLGYLVSMPLILWAFRKIKAINKAQDFVTGEMSKNS